MPDFNTTFDDLKSGLTSLIVSTLKKRSAEAAESGKAYLELVKNDLEIWTKQVAAGELSPEDVKWLVNSKKDLAGMILLKEKGLSLVAIDHFKDQLSRLLVGTITKGLPL